MVDFFSSSGQGDAFGSFNNGGGGGGGFGDFGAGNGGGFGFGNGGGFGSNAYGNGFGFGNNGFGGGDMFGSNNYYGGSGTSGDQQYGNEYGGLSNDKPGFFTRQIRSTKKWWSTASTGTKTIFAGFVVVASISLVVAISLVLWKILKSKNNNHHPHASSHELSDDDIAAGQELYPSSTHKQQPFNKQSSPPTTSSGNVKQMNIGHNNQPQQQQQQQHLNNGVGSSVNNQAVIVSKEEINSLNHYKMLKPGVMHNISMSSPYVPPDVPGDFQKRIVAASMELATKNIVFANQIDESIVVKRKEMSALGEKEEVVTTTTTTTTTQDGKVIKNKALSSYHAEMLALLISKKKYLSEANGFIKSAMLSTSKQTLVYILQVDIEIYHEQLKQSIDECDKEIYLHINNLQT